MFRSVCCCLPGRKPDYLQASETSHLLGASPSTEQPTAADRDLAQRYWAKAVDCHSRGDLDSAVAQFTRAAKLDPSRADVLLHLGTALQDRGDLDDAADCYRRVLSLDPTNHGALYNLGYVYEEQRQFDDAIRCFDDALRVAPHDADAAINVGNCYMQMDDVARAIRTYEKVVERDDTCAIGHYNLGSACHARRDLDKAARHFSRTTGVFDRMAHLSGWSPMVTALLGVGFAGPTNYSAMADFVVMVRGQSTMGLAGPALVKAGTGEEIDKEDVGIRVCALFRQRQPAPIGRQARTDNAQARLVPVRLGDVLLKLVQRGGLVEALGRDFVCARPVCHSVLVALGELLLDAFEVCGCDVLDVGACAVSIFVKCQ